MTAECSFKGECSGTCPKCDAEIRYLDAEINRKVENGEKVYVAGISPNLIPDFIEERCGIVDEEPDVDMSLGYMIGPEDWKPIKEDYYVPREDFTMGSVDLDDEDL